MNHTRARLGDCIFDYLASKPNRYIHHRQIFNDIRGSTGHRCSELTDTIEDRRYFVAVCNVLNNRYKNVRKFYRDNDIYLAFDKGAIDMDLETYNEQPWAGMQFTTIINQVFDDNLHMNFETDYYYKNFMNEPLLHEMIRYCVSNAVVKDLIRAKNLDITQMNDKSQTPLDVAISVRNTDMIIFLVRYGDEQKQIGVVGLPIQAPIIIDKSSELSSLNTLKYSVICFSLGFGVYSSYAFWAALSSLF